MKNKITQSIPILVALVVIGFRYFSQWCILTDSSCYGTPVHWIYLGVTSPLYFFAIYFLPIALILAFIPRHLFNSWLKFAVWALPLAFIFMALTPVWDSSLLPFSRDDAARLAGGLFSVISLIIICWKWFSSRRSGQV